MTETCDHDHDYITLRQKQSSPKYSSRRPLFVKISGPQVPRWCSLNQKGRRKSWGNNESYAQLIARAILAQPEQRIKLRDIYEWFVDNVPYFKYYDSKRAPLGWKNSIRHTLSGRKYFIRQENGLKTKESWWRLDTSTAEAQALKFVATKKKLKTYSYATLVAKNPLLAQELDKGPPASPLANKISDALSNEPSLHTVKLEPGSEQSASAAPIIEPNLLTNRAIPKPSVEDLLLVDIRQAMASFSCPAKQEEESASKRKRIITRRSRCVHSEGYIEINKPDLSQNWSNGLINRVAAPFVFGPVQVKNSQNTGTQTIQTGELSFLSLVLETKQLFEIIMNKYANKIILMQQLRSRKFVLDSENATAQGHCSSSAFESKDAQTQTAPTPEADLARELTNDCDIFNLMLEIDYDLLFSLIE